MSTTQKQITILFKGKRVVSLHRPPAPTLSSSATADAKDDVKTKHPHNMAGKRPREDQDEQPADLKRRPAPPVSSSATAASAHPVVSANDDVRTKHLTNDDHRDEQVPDLKRRAVSSSARTASVGSANDEQRRPDDLKKTTKLPAANSAATSYKAGEQVEVRSDDQGFKGAWYPATITAVLGDDRYAVKYRTLLTDDEERLLREKTWSRYIRPRRPRIRERPLKIEDKVDAWFNDGWWEGQITKRLGDRKWGVYFETYNEELVFPDSKLRLRLEWVNARWARPSNSNSAPNNTAPTTATKTNIGVGH